ncbi:MAG: glycosyltransferase family 2 protein, partial [Patescibacteria group bacterium]|nr:glycosyltransferase family 2 protein [Patescibacteria group bacterium]
SDYEIIVVDNASSDRTSEIAREFPIKVVHEPKKGLLHARERGRIEAAGEIIANIDADCLPEPDWLSIGASHFIENTTAAVTGPYDYHDAEFLFRHSSLLTQKYIYRLVSETVQLPFVRKGAMLIGGNNFIRTSVLEKSGGYNTALTFYGEDTDTAKRVSKHGKIVFNPKLIMKTSARRFKNDGVLATEGKYIFHFLKQTFKKPNSVSN